VGDVASRGQTLLTFTKSLLTKIAKLASMKSKRRNTTVIPQGRKAQSKGLKPRRSSADAGIAERETRHGRQKWPIAKEESASKERSKIYLA